MKTVTISRRSTISREYEAVKYFVSSASPSANQDINSVLGVGNIISNKQVIFKNATNQGAIYINEAGEIVVHNLRLMEILDFYVDNETVFFVNGKLTTAPGGKIFDETFDLTFN